MGDLGGFLKEQRQSARLSLRQLATAAGVSNPYLSQIERGLRKPSAEVLQQIAKGLQISAEALYLRAGILEESEGLQVEVAIQSDVNLTARQKRVLLDIYATFRAENSRTEHEAEHEQENTGSGTALPSTGRDGVGDDVTAERLAAVVEEEPTATATRRTAAKANAARTRAAKASATKGNVPQGDTAKAAATSTATKATRRKAARSAPKATTATEPPAQSAATE